MEKVLDDKNTSKETELVSFMNGANRYLSELLQIEATNDSDKQFYKHAILEAIVIYERRFKEIVERTEGNYRDENFIEKENKIKEIINQLKSKYNKEDIER